MAEKIETKLVPWDWQSNCCHCVGAEA